MNEDYFINENNFIRGTSWNGERAKGDGIFHTAQMAMFHNDPKLLKTCYELLKKRRRWPESCDDPRGPEFEHRKIEGFRSMTRDPYWLFYSACVKMDKRKWIKEIVPPWYVRRPNFMAWRKYLITGKSRHKKIYEGLELISIFLPIPPFAVYLSCWAAWIANSKIVQVNLRPSVQHWNLCERQLIHHPDMAMDQQKIRDYKPQAGVLWQSDIFYDNRELPIGQKYYLDRDALEFVAYHNRINETWS